MIRNPVVAGQFYPGSSSGLRKELKKLLNPEKEKEKAVGLLLPHAGYIYSGKTAALLYERVSIPQTAVILGPNHTGIGEQFSIMRQGRWKTPIGESAIDTALADEILGRSELLQVDEASHRYEHSIEIQLPFLQFLRKDVQVVPIILSGAELEDCRSIGNAIAGAIKESKADAIIIASSDMTHFEPAKSAKEKDKIALSAVTELDEKKLFDVVLRLNISMCGYIPVAAMLAASKKLGADKAELIDYTHSGEVTGEANSVVGYGAVLVSNTSKNTLTTSGSK